MASTKRQGVSVWVGAVSVRGLSLANPRYPTRPATMQEEFERQKASLASDSERASKKAGDRFVGNTDSIEETLKKSTIGLVSAEDFKKRREELEELKRREAAETSELK